MVTLGSSGGFVTPTALEAVAILFAPLVGQLTHEVAHYVAAVMLDADPDFNFRIRETMTVTYDELDVGDELTIGLAPTASGFAAVVVSIGVFGWPPPSYWLVAAGLAWTFHVLPSRADLAGLRQYTGPDEPLEAWEQTFWKGFIGLTVGAMSQMLPYNNAHVLYLLAFPIMAASLVMFGLGLLEKEKADSRGEAA